MLVRLPLRTAAVLVRTAALLGGLVLLSFACSGGAKAVQHVSLASVVASPSGLKGDPIQVQGELVKFTDPDGATYGAVQDSEMNRVGLKSIATWPSLVGKRVVATGVLEFDPSFGWYLSNPSLVAAPSP